LTTQQIKDRQDRREHEANEIERKKNALAEHECCRKCGTDLHHVIGHECHIGPESKESHPGNIRECEDAECKRECNRLDGEVPKEPKNEPDDSNDKDNEKDKEKGNDDETKEEEEESSPELECTVVNESKAAPEASAAAAETKDEQFATQEEEESFKEATEEAARLKALLTTSKTLEEPAVKTEADKDNERDEERTTKDSKYLAAVILNKLFACSSVWVADTGASFRIRGETVKNKKKLRKAAQPLQMHTAQGVTEVDKELQQNVQGLGTKNALYMQGSPNCISIGEEIEEDKVSMWWEIKDGEHYCILIDPADRHRIHIPEDIKIKAKFKVANRVPYLISAANVEEATMAEANFDNVLMQVLANDKLRTEFLEFCLPKDDKSLKAAQEITKSLSTAVKAEKEKGEQKLNIKEIIEKFMSKSPSSKPKLAEPAQQSREKPVEPEEQEKPGQVVEPTAAAPLRTKAKRFTKTQEAKPEESSEDWKTAFTKSKSKRVVAAEALRSMTKEEAAAILYSARKKEEEKVAEDWYQHSHPSACENRLHILH